MPGFMQTRRRGPMMVYGSLKRHVGITQQNHACTRVHGNARGDTRGRTGSLMSRTKAACAASPRRCLPPVLVALRGWSASTTPLRSLLIIISYPGGAWPLPKSLPTLHDGLVLCPTRPHRAAFYHYAPATYRHTVPCHTIPCHGLRPDPCQADAAAGRQTRTATWQALQHLPVPCLSPLYPVRDFTGSR